MTVKHSISNNISYLESRIKPTTLLVSGWNIHGFHDQFQSAVSVLQQNIKTKDFVEYRYPDELNLLSASLTAEIHNDMEAGIFPSATVGNFLLSKALKKLNKQNVLLIAPCYYSYLNIYLENKFTVFSHEFLDISKLKQTCLENSIEIIIFTEPLFCESNTVLNRELISWCENNNIFVVVDGVYGNLKWNKKFDHFLGYYDKYSNYSNLIIIESISKKAYLNGVKSAIFLTKQKKILQEMERLFNYMASPFSVGTLNLIELYLTDSQAINELIENHKETAKDNFEMIDSYLLNTCLKIEPCNQGYWAIIHVEKKQNQSIVESQIAIKILDACDIFTIPMGSYFKNYGYYYSFRVNLLSSPNELHRALSRLIRYFEKV